MLSTEEIAWRLVLAVVVGGLIGAEREYRSKSAGFRTLTLICLGAALFTILSELIGAVHAPERIASNVVVGIGFVGAGVIFRGEPTNSKVNGITTAAMIWVTAALGMGIGAGYKLISCMACLLVLLVILTFSMLEGWIERVNQIRNYKIICAFENETLHRYEDLFRGHHLSFKRSRQSKTDTGIITGEWVVQGSEKDHRHCIHEILRDPAVKAFEF
ncbi:MgtC/SapB family protein [Flavitalea sp. BT771]|uniref:MgtC/SapB family protein n=1 Tax=Flavitalea sp. BT771 TaxID=3063329 RepID=UPI0026E12BEF|nr:MgtC/SapB family protein [Flavitalea sp. BT771]MDO6431411.1 MgtC/SapB family protein [Flavitalea sp. BT771]MDV6220319.1 MgtC/SapB family protein [Flavitalea sp. BT771]